jgi:hypothetical protein
MHLANQCLMSIRPLPAPVWGVLTAVVLNGCCGPEQHSVHIMAPDQITVQLNNHTLFMYSNTSLTSPPVSSSKLGFIFNTLEGSSGGEGISLNFRGTEATSPQAMMLTLAVPVALRNGDVYTVGRTVSTDPNVGDDAALGPYDLAQSNQAEVAFTVSNSNFPNPDEVTYRATNTTGSIRVTNRAPDQVELTLDLQFTDANGTAATVTGRVQAINERNRASCS